MSDYLPKECLTDILVRVPVKSLLRFRCVSKTWDSLISSPAFITTHLHHAHHKANHGERSNQQDQFILFRHYSYLQYLTYDDHGYHCFDTKNEEDCFSLHKDDKFFPHNTSMKLKPPHEGFGESFRLLVGSMNGILCLVHYDECVFWNPSVNRTMKTTFQGYPSYKRVMHVLGLGCDPVTSDLKLVRLLYCEKNVVPPLVEIFTLSTNSWREVAAPGPMYIAVQGQSSPQAFVSGAYHWVAHTPPEQGSFCNVIMAFDMATEVFSEIALPSCLSSKPHLNMSVVTLFGSLALVPNNKSAEPKDLDFSTAVWIMKEYGVAESWTKLFDIDVGERGVERVITFRNNGELLLIGDWGKLLSYEPYTQETTDLHFGSDFRSFDVPSCKTGSYFVDTHMASLVLLNETDG